MNEFDKMIKNIEKNQTLNKFQSNKKEWLEDDNNNGYIKPRTKVTYWRMINSNISNIEIAYDKDLMNFVSIEIINLIKSAVVNSHQTKRTLFSMINNYMIYCVNRGFISYNPCDSIDTGGLFEVNTNALRNEYMNLEDFYEYVDKLEADDVQKMIYILVRYGCPIKSVPDVKYKDVDFENKIAYVLISDNLVPLPVDDEFLNRVQIANACHSMLGKKGYVQSEYLIKNTLTDEKLKKSSIYTIIEKVSANTGVQRIDMMMLYKSRRYDFVLNMAENKTVTFKDLKNILTSLGVGSSAAQITAFKKEIESIFYVSIENSSKRVLQAYRDGELIATGTSGQKLVNTLVDIGFPITRTTVNTYLKSGKPYNGVIFKSKN